VLRNTGFHYNNSIKKVMEHHEH